MFGVYKFTQLWISAFIALGLNSKVSGKVKLKLSCVVFEGLVVYRKQVVLITLAGLYNLIAE